MSCTISNQQSQLNGVVETTNSSYSCLVLTSVSNIGCVGQYEDPDSCVQSEMEPIYNRIDINY
jgi:hypothetical protein